MDVQYHGNVRVATQGWRSGRWLIGGGRDARGTPGYIAQQERLVRADMTDLADRYGVSSAETLRAVLSTREVHSHPAWEDAIECEHLEAYLAQRQAQQSRLASDV
jgi:hypothetical protein